MADDFYQAEEKVEAPEPQAPEQEVAKIKLGDTEYTQDELNALVEKGKFAREVEEKQNIKLDKVWPGHQELSNKVKDYERQIEELKQARVAAKVESGSELSEDEQKAQIRQELKRYGAVLEEDVNELFDRRMAAKDLLQDTQTVVEEFDEKYGIKTDEQTILRHMEETGMRNPAKAAKDLYEDTIDSWKEQQIQRAKPQGMVTDSTSSAGSKQPKAEPITNDNLFAKIDEVLDRTA